MTNNFVFYDYETTGIDPAMDRPIQFAACRAQADFQPLDQHEFKARLAGDVLPSPGATLVHGLSPAVLQRDGLSESEFAGRIEALFTESPQVIMGYNTASFDDPFTQHLFYRNFIDPYQWQFHDGNLRYDLIVAVRAAYLFAHDALVWPERDGQLSMKLEDLAPANGIEHLNAHDALGDTLATRDLAQQLAQKAPDLWQECLSMARKQTVIERIETAMQTHGALVLVDPLFGRERGYAGLVYPVGRNPNNANEMWCIDLGMDVEVLGQHSVEQLQHWLTLPKDQRDADTPRVPIKRIRMNKATAVFPLEKLGQHPDAVARAGIDRDAFKARRAWLRTQPLSHWHSLLEGVLGREYPVSEWVDAQLFDGLILRSDQAKMQQVRRSSPVDLMADPPTFDDTRLNELLPLYLGRNYAQELGPKAYRDWTRYRARRWQGPVHGRGMDLSKFTEELQEMALKALDAEQYQLMTELEAWAHRVSPL